METWRHRRQASVLLDSLNEAWRERSDYFAAANMFLYFRETQCVPGENDFRGPDVFVVLDTEKRERRSWVVWEEGGRTPDVVFELVSESTEKTDRGEKMQIYARVLHVACYVIYDPFTAQLDVFRLDAAMRAYVRVEADARGHYACDPLGMSLGVVRSTIDDADAPWLRLIDGEGRVLPEPAEPSAPSAKPSAPSAPRPRSRGFAKSSRGGADWRVARPPLSNAGRTSEQQVGLLLDGAALVLEQ